MIEQVSTDEYLKQIQKSQATRILKTSKEMLMRYFRKYRPDLWTYFSNSVKDEKEIDIRMNEIALTISDNYGPLDKILLRLKEKMLTACSSDEIDKLKNISVGSIYTNDPNGWVVLSPSRNPIIAIHTGIMHLSYYISILIAGLYKIENIEPKKINVNIIRPTQTKIKHFSKLLFNICSSLLTNEKFLPTDIHCHLNIMQHTLASYVAESMEMFILGHEMAHFYLKHLNKIKTQNSIKFYFNRSQQEEFNADYWSNEKVLVGKENSKWLINGGPLLLTGIIALEKTIDIYSKIQSYLPKHWICFKKNNTHPSTFLRRKKILQYLSNKYIASDPDIQLIKDEIEIFDKIINCMKKTIQIPATQHLIKKYSGDVHKSINL